ncbi:hypothetical protein HKK72_33285 [Actinomadura sp. HBU206391]|nr:hypothetical protein [Actinomadura sp. HBU206391]MBC6462690.1 hypothetical protein [Actinomadura sp. HBU206391]
MKAITAIEVLRDAVAWFVARGVNTQRVLGDNGSAYRPQEQTTTGSTKAHRKLREITKRYLRMFAHWRWIPSSWWPG